ncbi:MAG: DUF1761 domain-containing protein [Patescibacteria group bacterium]
MLCNVNIWAVIVSAVVAMIIGALWYSKVLFGSTWMALTGWTGVLSTEEKKSIWKSYLIQFIGTIVMIFILARLLFLSGTQGVMYSMIMAFWLWLGFTATFALGAVLWEKKPLKLAAINTGSTLVSLLVAAIILAVW